MRRIFRPGSSARHVLTLMTGTALAQAIPVAISPILTRLYTPADMGLLALFMALAAIPAAIASGRYELAIQLVEDDDEALNVAALSLVIAIGVTVVLLAIALFAGDPIADLTGKEDIRPWLYLVPVSVFLSALLTILTYLNGRAKQFRDVANASVFKSVVLAALQLGGGVLKAGAAGLIVGQVASLLAANGRLFRNAARGRNLRAIVSRGRMRNVAVEHARLPKVTLWAGLANSMALNGTGILISVYYATSTLGFYALVQRVLNAPITLIGTAAGQVFFQRASHMRNAHGNAYPVFKRASRALMLLSVLIFLPLFFVIEPIFAFVFGEEWREAGRYAQILVPLFAVRFVVSPLSTMNQVNRRNGVGLIFNLLLLTSSIGSVVIFGITHRPAIELFAGLAASQTLVYVAFLVHIEYSSRGSSGEPASESRRA